MIGQLLLVTSSGSAPAYLIDGAGSLIRRESNGPENALIPFATTLVSSTADLKHPMAWTVSVDDVEQRISKAMALGANAAGLEAAYPGGKVPHVDMPFVLPESCPDDAVTIESALDLLVTLPSEEAEPIVEYLKTCGIVRIPQTATFNQAIHEAVQAAMVLPPLVFLSDGWMSYIKVYRKSVVRSA